MYNYRHVADGALQPHLDVCFIQIQYGLRESRAPLTLQPPPSLTPFRGKVDTLYLPPPLKKLLKITFTTMLERRNSNDSV